MRKIFILSLLIISILTAFVLPASAAELDPYELADLVEADGANDKLYITFPEDDFYWRWVHDGKLAGTGYGNPFQYTTQMRYVDNDVVYFYPFGKDNFFPAEGLSNNALFDYNFRFWLSCTNQTQDFTAIGKLYLFARYKDGTTGSVLVDELTATKSVNSSISTFMFTRVDKAIDLTNVESFYFYFAVDFNGVANENDTASVTVGCDVYFRLIFSLSAYYREVAAVGKTNALIQEVQTQLAEQGKTFDDVLKETQQNGEKLDDVIQGNEQIHDDIDNAVNGTLPPADFPAGNDKIDDLDNQEGQLRDDASDGLQQGLDMMDDTLDALFTYSFGFFALGLIFELFFQIPFFNVLVSLSLVLGILASFLGIIVSISSAGGGRYSKAKSHHQRSPKSNQPKHGGKA